MSTEHCKDDIYLKDLIFAIKNVEGGKEYVKNFNDHGGFVNSASNPIQKQSHMNGQRLRLTNRLFALTDAFFGWHRGIFGMNPDANSLAHC